MRLLPDYGRARQDVYQRIAFCVEVLYHFFPAAFIVRVDLLAVNRCPAVPQMYLANVYTYYLKLSHRPYSSSSPSVYVDVDIVDNGGTGMKSPFCALLQTSVQEFSFETWNTSMPIQVKVAKHEYSLRKYTYITSCLIKHAVRSSDSLYSNLSPIPQHIGCKSGLWAR